MNGAASFGIVPRIPDALEFAARSRVLLLRHAKSEIDLDVAFTGLQFERVAVEKSRVHKIAGIALRLPRVEDLLVMKAVAHRPKDLEDIRVLLAAHPDTDVVAVRRWVREFATATSMPDMLNDLDKVLAERTPQD